MKTNLLSKFLLFPTQIGALALALICFSSQAHAGPLLRAVGPHSSDDDKVSTGYLEVYSSTEASSPAGFTDGDSFNPHSAYWIYTNEGKKIRTVQNHGSFPEEGPDKVELTPGTYVVKAWSDDDGLVTVPVIIKLAQTTRVHLESGPDNDEVPAGDVIVGQPKVAKKDSTTQTKVATKD